MEITAVFEEMFGVEEDNTYLVTLCDVGKDYLDLGQEHAFWGRGRQVSLTM